jgi:lipopolysaccharide transport system permease protein
MHDLLIEAGRTERQYWRDVWRYRELFYFLAWRDILVRYKQTVIGISWTIIRPLITMVVLSFVFGRLAKMPSGGVPYPVLVFAGVLPWQFFASAITESGNSVVSNSALISKVYFPRLAVPASSVITSLIDLIVSGMVLAMLMAYYGVRPSSTIMLLPVFVALAFALAFGAGLWISALMVKYRDFRFIVPFVVQFGLYISPVGFASGVVDPEWRLAYSLNPMVGVIDGFRWALLGGGQFLDPYAVLMSMAAVTLLLATGFRYFRHTERTFADII